MDRETYILLFYLILFTLGLVVYLSFLRSVVKEKASKNNE